MWGVAGDLSVLDPPSDVLRKVFIQSVRTPDDVAVTLPDRQSRSCAMSY